MRYDPDKGPEAKKWLALDEGEGIELVRRYHRQAGIKVPRLLVHSALHATVETQIAMGIGAVCAALDRLRKDGLSRHDAIHAIASVLAWEMNKALQHESDETVDLNELYERELDKLTAAEWLAESDE